MALRFFNGLQLDVPEGWVDLSTVVLAPLEEGTNAGKKPTINLVVKRRPSAGKDLEGSLSSYLGFMGKSVGPLEGLEVKELNVAGMKGRAVRFSARAEGQRFVQTTLLYHAAGDEIAATVTQLEGDSTSPEKVERLLVSVRPAAAPAGWR